MINYHQHNIDTLNAIIQSLNNYLSHMQSKHMWRDEKNRSDAIIHWRNKFIECKEELQSFHSDLMLKINTISIIKNQSDFLYKQIIEDIKSLPNIVTNTNQTITYRGEFNSQSSNIDIIRIWEKKYNTDITDIPRRIGEISEIIKKYNFWIAESEIAQSMNYKEMSPMEKFIKDIIQENEIGRSLRKHILEYSFYNANINTLLLNDYIKKIE